ncbi:DUF1654 domain-containing protein [Pseudomonas aeruginosa]|uniref:DUF1654 domain-containing protein n=1 Tax=Pseudomonas aeruginosa TaxID=287 RepID=UPI000F54715E|nr:DUF1654 domain-containing protein [Pseudomonas aeruginosa]MBX5999094.1 DUF1654 domain-containing protein [Pseudomonas aeruginosa]QYN15852.1 DUF1654 domain-containing protein [Pseudomonas aeruginosa]RQA39283.1 hypothetical protein IPC495_12690 [Pseudomonas aeruginosa]HDQ4152918.1 DUF1654 domain-containing protein [Pseudomonas aeruginosa]HEK1433637.1 DUF1654 domain-containing protein [Pseudomonas aeruginosa]
MARKGFSYHTTPSPFEILARRIRQQLLTQSAQLARRTVIKRMPDEPEESWLRLLDELSQEDFLTITHQQDGSIELTWPYPPTDW